MDELEKIVAESRCPDEIKPLILTEARAIIDSQKEKTNPQSAVREAYDFVLEGAEPTVLISIPDDELRTYVTDRLRGEVRIIDCNNPETLKRYLDQRTSKRFNVIAVLGEANPEKDSYPHRNMALEEIIHGSAKPVIGWVRIGNKSSMSSPTDSTERLPRAYSIIRALITEIENSIKGNADTPDVGTRVSPNWLAAQLSRQPEDHSTRLRLAADRLSERRYAEALSEYETVLRSQPKNLAAIIGRSTALLSQSPDNTALANFEAHGKKGLPALLADLQDHAQYESDPLLDYLVGKAIVHTHLQQKFNPSKQPDPQSPVPLLDDAIQHLEKAFRQKRVNVDAGVSLALAYALRGGKDDNEVAYELFLETLRFSDPLTEPLGRFVEYERAGKEVMGTQLLQLTGLHRAFSIGSGQFVLKRYERNTTTQRQSWERPGEGKRAKIEQKNITYCHENKERIRIHSHGRKQQIETPGWSLLIESARGEYIFEIMPYLAGRNVGEIFERLTEAARTDPAKKRDAATLKIKHLEWITDACAALQTTATMTRDGQPREGLERVKDARYPVEIEKGRTIDVSWYTVRVFQKLVELYASVVPEQPVPYETLDILRKKRVALKEPKKREQLIKLIEPIAAKLTAAPDWLYVAYTDNNLRNYSVEIPPGVYQTEEAYITDSRKKRYDLENAVVLLGTSDQLTAVEHELCDTMQENDRMYLMNRWLGRILLARHPRPQEGARGRVQYEQLREVMDELDAYEGVKRERLSKGLRKYLKKIDDNFPIEEYHKLVRLDSLLRHLTIHCDKVREAYRVYAKVKDLADQHDLHTWKPQFSWKQKALELREHRQGNTPEGQYAHLRGVLEDLDRYHTYHRDRLIARLNDTRQDKLAHFLKTNYGLIP